MTIALRPYQLEAIQRVRLAFLAGHRSVLFVLPTGGGKTVVFSHIAQQAAANGHRVGVLVHRVELLDQACRALDAIGLRHGVIAANRSMNLSAPVQVASVQTLARRLDWVPPDFFQLLIPTQQLTLPTETRLTTHLHLLHVQQPILQLPLQIEAA